MPQNLSSTEAEDDPYVQSFARHLIDCLGVEGAIRVCRENHWDGALIVIRTVRDRLRTSEEA